MHIHVLFKLKIFKLLKFQNFKKIKTLIYRKKFKESNSVFNFFYLKNWLSYLSFKFRVYKKKTFFIGPMQINKYFQDSNFINAYI